VRKSTSPEWCIGSFLRKRWRDRSEQVGVLTIAGELATHKATGCRILIRCQGRVDCSACYWLSWAPLATLKTVLIMSWPNRDRENPGYFPGQIGAGRGGNRGFRGL
jgi:hypothetical protein